MRRFCSSTYCYYNGEILLIEHKKLKLWLPVGGGREGDETPLETAKRELLEETGIIDAFFPPSQIEGAPDGFFGYSEYTTSWGDLHMVHAFLANVTNRNIKPDGSFEKWDWFTPKEVRAMAGTTPNVRWAAEHIRGWKYQLDTRTR